MQVRSGFPAARHYALLRVTAGGLLCLYLAALGHQVGLAFHCEHHEDKTCALCTLFLATVVITGAVCCLAARTRPLWAPKSEHTPLCLRPRWSPETRRGPPIL